MTAENPEWSLCGKEAARRFMMRALINVLAEKSGNSTEFRRTLRAEMDHIVGRSQEAPCSDTEAAFKRGIALEMENLLSPPVPRRK